MKRLIDLHVHSNCSDGTYTPTELVAYALEKKLSAFALTDHDTIDGIHEAVSAAEGTNLEIIPGIELSTNYKGKDIHLLGLNIDDSNHHFQEHLLRFQSSREIRNQKMIEKLQEARITISYERMLEAFGKAVWTRAHFARYLLDNGYIKSMKEAFERYIGDRSPCYVAREKVTPRQGIQLIQQGGGIAVLAHPLLYHVSHASLEQMVIELKKAGLDGLEAIYSTNKWVDETNMTHLAKKHQLKISGGSDFHGSNKPAIDLGCGKGNLEIPYEIWQNLKSK